MTKKKTAANRRNAALSTGPKATETTSQNALKHGLTSAQPNKVDFHTGYNEMLAGLMAEVRPAGLIESLYVQRAALAATRLQRLVKLQGASLDAPQQTVGSIRTKGLSPLDLYKITFPDMNSDGNKLNPGDLRGAVRTLPEIIRELTTADGFKTTVDMDALSGLLDRFSTNMESFFGEDSGGHAVDPAAALAAEVPHSKMLRYETQLENSMYKALHELERLKRIRAGDRSVTAPIAMDLTVHGAGEGEPAS